MRPNDTRAFRPRAGEEGTVRDATCYPRNATPNTVASQGTPGEAVEAVYCLRVVEIMHTNEYPTPNPCKLDIDSAARPSMANAGFRQPPCKGQDIPPCLDSGSRQLQSGCWLGLVNHFNVAHCSIPTRFEAHLKIEFSILYASASFLQINTRRAGHLPG